MARAQEFLRELKRLRPQRKLDDLKDDDYERLQDEITRIYGSAKEFHRAINAERAASAVDGSDAISAERALFESLEAEGALPERIEAERIEAELEGLEAKGASSERIEAAIALSERIEAAKALPEGLEADRPSRDVIEAIPPAQAEIERLAAASVDPSLELYTGTPSWDQIRQELPTTRLNLRDTPSLGLDQIPAADLQALAAAHTLGPQLLFAGDAAARALPSGPAPRQTIAAELASPPVAPAPPPVAQIPVGRSALAAAQDYASLPRAAQPAVINEQVAAAPPPATQPLPPMLIPAGSDRLLRGAQPAVAQQFPTSGEQFAELSAPGGPVAPAVGPAPWQIAGAPPSAAPIPPMLSDRLLSGAQTAAAPAPAAAVGRQPLIDFKENPLGAIGLVLSNIAAGYQGRELPTTALRRIRVQQEAASLNKLQLGLNMQAQILKSTAHLTGDAREAAIRKQSAPIVKLLGQDFLDGVLAASQRDPGRFNPTLHSELLPAIMGPGGPCGHARGSSAQSECFLKIVGDEDTLAALYQVHDDSNAQGYAEELSAVEEELMKHPAGAQLMKALRDKYPGGGNMPLSDYIRILDAVPGRFGVSNETIQALRRNPARYGFMGEGAEATLQANVLENQLTRDDAVVKAQVRLNAALSTEGGRVPVVTEVRDAMTENMRARGMTISASNLPSITAMAEARIAMATATTAEAFAEAQAAHRIATNRLDPPNETSRLAQIRLAQDDLERLDDEERQIRQKYAEEPDFPPEVQTQLDAISSDKAVNANLIAFLTGGENLTPEERTRYRQEILREFGDTTIAPFIIRNILGLPTDMTNQQVREAGLAHELTEAQSTALPQAAAGAQVFMRMAEALAKQIEAGGDVSVGLAGGTSILVDEMVHGARGIFALVTGIGGADEARQQEFLAAPNDGEHDVDKNGNMLDDNGDKIVSETPVDLSDVRHYEDILDERGFSVANQKLLGRTAGEAAKIRARVIALAFTLARSEEGGRLTDQDVKYAIRRIGVSSNAKRFAAVLRQTISDVQEKYRITVRNTLGAMPVSPYLSPEDVTVLGGHGSVIAIKKLPDADLEKLSLKARKWIAMLLQGGYEDIEVGGVNVDG